MSICLALLVMLAPPLAPTLNMRRLAKVPFGPSGERIVCCDSDHDSLPEMVFHTGSIRPGDPLRIEFWELQGWNRFRLVYADTGAYPEPIGITAGNGIPYSAGDVDGDGLTDLLCRGEELPTPDSFYWIVMTLESPNSFSYPCSLSWYERWNADWYEGIYPLPADEDSQSAFICGGRIWGNVGNNQNEVKWTGSLRGWNFAFRDFDRDGRNDIGTGWSGAEVWECTGDYQYELAWRDTLDIGNGEDVFSTADIDGDGRPEFYESFMIYSRDRSYLYMYEDESEGSHIFTRTLVDSISGPCGGSAGGDIDGDGVDECIWTTLAGIRVYKAVGNNDLLQVWEWGNDHIRNWPGVTVYDVNSDGYNELLFAGTFETSIFEVDAVDLLSPNGGSCSVGDTVLIRWATHASPRCDSLSLFVRRDSAWRLDTIATGLPATDTLYRWAVPDDTMDTCRIVVMAYGPGWQYDISDSVIYILPVGVTEGPRCTPIEWALAVSPNPARGAVTVSYDVPLSAHVLVGIYDVDGRLARTLAEGVVAPGQYRVPVSSAVLPAGVYFVRLDAGGTHLSTKVVLTE